MDNEACTPQEPEVAQALESSLDNGARPPPEPEVAHVLHSTTTLSDKASMWFDRSKKYFGSIGFSVTIFLISTLTYNALYSYTLRTQGISIELLAQNNTRVELSQKDVSQPLCVVYIASLFGLWFTSWWGEGLHGLGKLVKVRGRAFHIPFANRFAHLFASPIAARHQTNGLHKHNRYNLLRIPPHTQSTNTDARTLHDSHYIHGFRVWRSVYSAKKSYKNKALPPIQDSSDLTLHHFMLVHNDNSLGSPLQCLPTAVL